MKITAVETRILRHHLSEPFGFSQWWNEARTSMLVKITADNGLVGWGESHGPAQVTSHIVEAFLQPLLLGADPLETGVLWDLMYRRSRDYGQKGTMVAAISGVDIALWDLKGRALGVPISTLLGGRHEEWLEAYASGLYFRQVADPVAAAACEAEQYAAEGFRWIKMKVGQLPEEDVARIRAARGAIGPERQLLIDANHAFPAHHAIRLAREVADCRPYWFEEPVAPEDYAGYQQVREALSPLGIAIAGGEAEYTRFGFRELCGRRCVDIAQPDLGAAGGFTDGLFIAGIGNAHGVEVLPHCWGSAVALAAGLHYLAALPNCPGAARMPPRLIEYDRMENPLRDELVPGFPERDGSRLRVPSGPGLGIEIDEARLERWVLP